MVEVIQSLFILFLFVFVFVATIGSHLIKKTERYLLVTIGIVIILVVLGKIPDYIQEEADSDASVFLVPHEYTPISMHDRFVGMYDMKPNVKADSLIPAMDTAAVKVAHCFRDVLQEFTYKPLVTSANDSRHHRRNSYHYKNAALDIRIKNLSWKNRSKVIQCVHDSLDESRFYVRHESIGTPFEHLHVHCFKK